MAHWDNATIKAFITEAEKDDTVKVMDVAYAGTDLRQTMNVTFAPATDANRKLIEKLVRKYDDAASNQ
jgi:hypothetical protein